MTIILLLKISRLCGGGGVGHYREISMGVVVFAKVQGLVKSELLRLCMSEDLCKNYYFYLNFVVETFLTKIQNWCYKTTKKLVKTHL